MVFGFWVGRREAKIGQENLVLGNQDVLGLEIPVIDAQVMTMLHGVQDLEKCLSDGDIVADVPTFLGDV